MKVELTEVEVVAMQVYADCKEVIGDDVEFDDPEELAIIATTLLNTVIHLGGLVERLQKDS